MSFAIQIGAKPFDYTAPWDHEFDIREAVKALSFIPRFGGHAQGYSVAQHSVLVSVIAKHRPWDGLAHDLAEAYYGDLPTPLKRLMRECAPLLAARFNAIDIAVESAFLFIPDAPGVKEADLQALSTERRDLLPKGCDEIWGSMPSPLDYTIIPLTPAEAEKAWWRQYHKLLAAGKAPRFRDIPKAESVLT